MNDQPGAEQLGTIETSQLPAIAGGATSPGYGMPYPVGPYGWALPAQPAPHAPGHPPAPHAPVQPKPPVPTCHYPMPPSLPYGQPYGQMWPGFFSYGGFSSWPMFRPR